MAYRASNCTRGSKNDQLAPTWPSWAPTWPSWAPISFSLMQGWPSCHLGCQLPNFTGHLGAQSDRAGGQFGHALSQSVHTGRQSRRAGCQFGRAGGHSGRAGCQSGRAGDQSGRAGITLACWCQSTLRATLGVRPSYLCNLMCCAFVAG